MPIRKYINVEPAELVKHPQRLSIRNVQPVQLKPLLKARREQAGLVPVKILDASEQSKP